LHFKFDIIIKGYSKIEPIRLRKVKAMIGILLVDRSFFDEKNTANKRQLKVRLNKNRNIEKTPTILNL
jgi:hypothetical protein